jgi:signal transduction histidine kinase
LTVLFAAEVLTALVLVAVGLFSVTSLASRSAFLRRYVLVPIQAIDGALEDVGRLSQQGGDRTYEDDLRRLDAFVRLYRNEIQVAGNTGPDVRRQTGELRQAHRLDLVDEEQQVVAALQQDFERLSSAQGDTAIAGAVLEDMRLKLRQLLRINLDFVDAAEADIASNAARMRAILVAVGILGIGLAGALAWQVRRAIAPRIAELVNKVRKFQELGVIERSHIEGHDDIAVLGHAIDVGFAAIAERNREREQFLAVAAHELKTPMMSILGFIHAALAHPERQVRALEVVGRQTKRLGHLVEELLWAASVRTGQLPFRPEPLDLAEVARHTADEVAETAPDHPIAVHGPPSIHLLGDETLVAHALWTMLTYAGVLSRSNEPIDLAVETSDARVLVTLALRGPPLSAEDRLHVFEPFSMIQYEDARPRSAFGLFLCREIARVHGGTLLVSERAGVGPVLTMDLPA